MSMRCRNVAERLWLPRVGIVLQGGEQDVKVAYIHGEVARGAENRERGIDIILVGDANFSAVAVIKHDLAGDGRSEFLNG